MYSDLAKVEDYLTNVLERISKGDEDQHISTLLKFLKQKAVTENNQDKAKYIWCLESIQKIQNSFITAYHQMREHYFYYAWGSLEQVEIGLIFLSRHFDLNTFGKDKHKLQFINNHTRHFQEIFTYKLFISPGFIAREKLCTICLQPISIQNPCGHVVGEIYNGEMCSRKITKLELLETSLVTNPVQKYSVAFFHSEDSESIDNYNYTHVDYVVQRLRHPFAMWDKNWVNAQRTISEFAHVGRNEKCPCGSGQKFKKCCMKKSAIDFRHLDVKFFEGVPSHLPLHDGGRFIRGKGSPKDISSGSDIFTRRQEITKY